MTATQPVLLINAGSGSASDIRTPACEIVTRMAGVPLRCVYEQPEDLNAAVAAEMERGCDLLISFGGDGTHRHSAETARAHDIPLIALPGGTMNLLAKAIYGTQDWRAALEVALASPVRWQSGGIVSDATSEHVFLCGGYVGKPARLNAAREAARDGDVVEIAAKLKDVAAEIEFDDTLNWGPDARTRHAANLISIGCPGINGACENMHRLDVTGANPEDMRDLADIAAKAVQRRWGEADAATHHLCEAFTVSYDAPPDVLMDGEPLEMSAPLSFRVEPHAVRVMAPDYLGDCAGDCAA